MIAPPTRCHIGSINERGGGKQSNYSRRCTKTCHRCIRGVRGCLKGQLQHWPLNLWACASTRRKEDLDYSNGPRRWFDAMARGSEHAGGPRQDGLGPRGLSCRLRRPRLLGSSVAVVYEDDINIDEETAGQKVHQAAGCRSWASGSK